MAVGYLSLHNRSNLPLAIESITSPQFGLIEIHETILQDGIARMQALPAIIIPPESRLDFEPGGKHLMMMQPQSGLTVATEISMEIRYNSGGLLLLVTQIQARMPASQAE